MRVKSSVIMTFCKVNSAEMESGREGITATRIAEGGDVDGKKCRVRRSDGFTSLFVEADRGGHWGSDECRGLIPRYEKA